MASPKLTELSKIARKRSALLRSSEKGLLDKASSLEVKLNDYILKVLLPSLDIKNGKILNSNANLKFTNSSTGLKKFIKDVVNSAMFDFYDKQFNGLTGATEQYYNKFEPTAAQEKAILERGQLIINGFVDDLFDNNQIAKALQQTIRNGITSSQSLVDVGKLLTEQIEGKEDKFGLIKSYHYQNGYDQFQAYSRGLDEQFSQALNLNYAIYAGGEIRTTRVFCDERAGNVYNRETILSWDDLDWQGKKANNNILIDLGGYNCRHDLDWISYQLAKRIDPSIEKSEFDKK